MNWHRMTSRGSSWERSFHGKVGHVLHGARGFTACYDGIVLGHFPLLSLAKDRVEAEASP